MDGGAWWAKVHGVTKSRTRLSDFTFTFHFHALEKEMTTHSSVLAWRIPGTGAWWAAIYGVAHSRTRLKWLSSSSILSYGYATFCISIHPTVDTWVSRMLKLLWAVLLYECRWANISSRHCFQLWELFVWKWNCWTCGGSAFTWAALWCAPTSGEWGSVSPHPHQHLFCPVGLLVFHSSHPNRYLVGFTYISLMSNDVEHLFMCLLAIHVSSLEILKSFSHFWISLCCCILGILYRFWILTPYRICGLWIFPPPWGLPFHSVHSVFHCTKFKKLNEPSLSVFSFVTCVFGVISKKSLPSISKF